MSNTLSPRDTRIVETKGSIEGHRVESWYYTEDRHRDVYVEVKLATGEWTLIHLKLPR